MAANLAERATDPHSICILFFVANYYYEKKYFIISEIRNLFRFVRNMAWFPIIFEECCCFFSPFICSIQVNDYFINEIFCWMKNLRSSSFFNLEIFLFSIALCLRHEIKSKSTSILIMTALYGTYFLIGFYRILTAQMIKTGTWFGYEHLHKTFDISLYEPHEIVIKQEQEIRRSTLDVVE